MDMGIAGSTAVVTGGTSGIGLATAVALAREGCRVAVCGRTESTLRDATRDVAQVGEEQPLGIQADVRDSGSVARLFEQVTRELGGVDILVNCAGAAVPAPYTEMTDQRWLDAFDYKFLGYVRCCMQALPLMRARGGGSIVNVAGTAAKEPNPWTTSSGAVNAALLNCTKTMSRSFASSSIRVNAVSPGPTATERWTTLASLEPERAAQIEANMPLGRLVAPEEVADAVMFLASPRAAGVNGTTLVVDGGRMVSVAA